MKVSNGISRKSTRVPFEQRVLRFTLLVALPGLISTAVLVWAQSWELWNKVTVLGIEALLCLIFGAALRDHVVRPIRTLTNVVGALRERDYSLRASYAFRNDALGELSLEINALADLLAKVRTGEIEANELVQRIVREVDVPIFAFDRAEKLCLVNPAGEKLMRKSAENLFRKTAMEMGLGASLSCENGAVISFLFACETRCSVRRTTFRQQGVPLTLVVLSDVSRALREEEQRAWQRLIRVIGHELNNSLTPIKSIANSLRARLAGTPDNFEWRADFQSGLEIIENRAASLNRFLQAYRQLAQMPLPDLRECSVSALVEHAAAMEPRAAITVIASPKVRLLADPDQLEQMLINLLRNAAEAVSEYEGSENVKSVEAASPPIKVAWKTNQHQLVLTIEDSGPGLLNPSNAFIPFYTTKKEGSGIGLLLARQVCEAHGGSFELRNRSDRHGCVASIVLPLDGRHDR